MCIWLTTAGVRPCLSSYPAEDLANDDPLPEQPRQVAREADDDDEPAAPALSKDEELERLKKELSKVNRGGSM